MAESGRVETDQAVPTIRLDRPPMAGPARALRAGEQAIDSGLDVDLPAGLEMERLNFAALSATEDQRTGMRSFVENGPGKATFAGR
jgi:enoyl-CoA hydratase/carnithine racemase